MDKKTIVVVGAGQGLGNHVAKRFGKEGFRVVLMRGKSVTNIPNCKEATFPRRTIGRKPMNWQRSINNTAR